MPRNQHLTNIMYFKYYFLGILSMLMINIGCHSNENKFLKKTPGWISLTIISEDFLHLKINHNDDISVIKTYDRGGFFTGWHKLKIDSTQKKYFSTAEKKQIFELVEQIIIDSIAPKRHCTEFIGDLELEIDYGRCKKKIEYSGVCDWASLSTQTQRLNDILTRKGVFEHAVSKK